MAEQRPSNERFFSEEERQRRRADFWHQGYLTKCEELEIAKKERDQFKQIAELNAETIRDMQKAGGNLIRRMVERWTI